MFSGDDMGCMGVKAEARIPRLRLDAFAKVDGEECLHCRGAGCALFVPVSKSGRLRCRCRCRRVGDDEAFVLEMALRMIDLIDVHILFVLLHQNCWSFFYLLFYAAHRVVFLRHNIWMCKIRNMNCLG